ASDVGAAKSVQAALSSITGLPCKIVHISVCSPELLTGLNPRGIVIGGQKTPWWQYSPAELNGVYRMLRASRVPTLGICGGHQLITKAFGGRVAPIRILRKGSKGYSGCYRERGWKPIKLQQGDPLFKGIGAVPRMWLNHCEEIKVIPQQFRTIGRGDVCKIQTIRHGTLPIYGMQFHPESADDAHPAGRQLLRNFVTMCKAQ
ncbi:MAG: gamma-glutamyl-gamma-aminobutyrate hydrolase family protein, partial [Armatimonadia bacterium]